MTLFANKVSPWRPDLISGTDLMAVFAGTHGQANGLDAALNAAARLKIRGRTDIKIVLIGDGQRKESLMTRAASEGLDNVVFCDPVGKAKLAGLMASTDLGLQLLANVPAFYYGTSPNKFFDYIASGLPVLINYPGWLADVINEHQCGFAVEADNAEAFADALVFAADHRSELRLMGQRSLHLARSKFDRAMLAAQFITWLRNAAKK
jgi:glycosyltransferase involved in cell wall biosynthesis